MQYLKSISLVLAVSIILSACENAAQKPVDTLSKGNIDISVDETYKPIIEQQIKVFDSSFPEGHIKANYKPETECIKDFMDGNARVILVTRELSANEKQVLEQKKVVPTTLAIAKDAIAVVVNNASGDSVLSIEQLKGILTGTYKTKYTVVFDNQGSSTLRYMLDSIIPGEKLGANVFAAKGNDSVIAYVAAQPGSIGFVGVSHTSDYEDPAELAFISTVRVVSIYNDKLQKAYQPYQAFIATGHYKLTRNLYFINRETYPGLGTGFTNFLSKERGQLLFKQARLFPLRSNIVFRDASVNP